MGWIVATSFLLVGRYLLSKKEKLGWAYFFTLIGDSIWIFVGWHMGAMGVASTAGIMASLDLWAFIKINSRA